VNFLITILTRLIFRRLGLDFFISLVGLLVDLVLSFLVVAFIQVEIVLVAFILVGIVRVAFVLVAFNQVAFILVGMFLEVVIPVAPNSKRSMPTLHSSDLD